MGQNMNAGMQKTGRRWIEILTRN